MGPAACILAPQPAFAHAFAQRYDLPLPLGYFIAGAALAVALSFLGSFLLGKPLSRDALSIRIPVPGWLAAVALRTVLGVALLLLAAVAVTGVLGPASPTKNFATVFVWVIWWVGFVLFTALAIDLWSAGNPFRATVDTVLRALPRRAAARRLPGAAGWLAVLGLVLISWIETVSDWSEDPRMLVAIAGVYLVFLLAGSAAFGAAAWFAAADPLTRLFGLLGHVAPLKAEASALRLRVPASGLVGVDTGGIGAVFTVTLIALVLFDGLSETPFWAGILDAITRSQGLRGWLLDLRAAGIDILKLIQTLGLLATALAALAAYLALSVAIWVAAGRVRPWNVIFSGFAGSLLPIAVAYHLAHYVSYLVLAGQLMIPIASDPLAMGWDLFGGARRTLDLGAITAAQVWWIAAAALVVGHALSVFVAHAEAMRLMQDRRRAIRSQLPMMVFMVGLTALSLWILAQPIVA
ncbi:MAG TPA: hypothetical protein VLA52_05760 [Thermohalobaculum sp.]|nr:hypothetical protein [Thermohalobaculum sp.]